MWLLAIKLESVSLSSSTAVAPVTGNAGSEHVNRGTTAAQDVTMTLI